MTRSYRKNTLRTFKSTASRFAAVFAIVALGVGFLAGLNATPIDMKESMERYMDDGNFYDLRIVSTLGLTDEDVDALRQVEGVRQVQPGYSADLLVEVDGDTVVSRVHSLPAPENNTINQLNLVEGRLPEKSGECVIEASYTKKQSTYTVGTKLVVDKANEDLDTKLSTTEYTVVGIVHNANYFSFFTDATGVTLSATAIISLLAWGLGYFGQPHILVRFMGISSAKEIPQATRIAMVWVIFSLFFAVTVGLVGRVLLGDTLTGVNAETVFMVLNNEFFVSFLAGIIISAILGAIMSTSSSQLLVTASAISTDFYQALLRKNAGEKELVFVSRLSVILVACCSLALASNPNNYILELVAYAWAGFGASFGPLVLFSLFWRRTTIKGAIAGVFFGGSTVLIWKEFFAYTGIYEIVPGFIISALAIYVVSLLDKKPDAAIVKDFDVAEAHIQDM